MNSIISQHDIKGKCVHASKDYQADELIDVNYVLPFKHLNRDWGDLDTHRMAWNKSQDCIALGHINLLNHSENPNVYIKKDFKIKRMSMFALRNIKAGEELTIHYECDLWFEPIEEI